MEEQERNWQRYNSHAKKTSMRYNWLKLQYLLAAGSFGNYINPENAKLIGLVPDVPAEKIKFVGNTALTGAKMALISAEARKTAEMLSKRIRYIELAGDPDFPSEFAEAMFIPHKNPDRFPSAKKYVKNFKENTRFGKRREGIWLRSFRAFQVILDSLEQNIF